MNQIHITQTTITSLESYKQQILEELQNVNNAIQYHKNTLAKLNGEPAQEPENTTAPVFTGNIRTVIDSIFDNAKRPLKLSEVQNFYTEKTGKDFSIREYLRGMNKKKELLIMKINNSNKNAYWVKADWVQEGKLKAGFGLENFGNTYDIDLIKFV